MAKYSSKSLNNFLIIGILLFVTAINLPTILKKAYQSLPQNSASDTITFLPKTPIEKIVFPNMTLSYDNQWRSQPKLAIDAETLVERWQNLQGTPILMRYLPL